MPPNLQAIQNASFQLQSLNDSTNRAQERRLLIERQIADTQASFPVPCAVPPATGDPSTPSQQLEPRGRGSSLYADATLPITPKWSA